MLSIVFSGFLTFFGTSTSITSSICSPLTSPTIMTPINGDAITQSVVQIQGASSSGSTVEISVDGTPNLAVVADQSGSFGGSLTLANGSYNISVTASNPCQSIGGNQIDITVDAPVPPTPINPSTPPTTTQPPSRPAASGSRPARSGGAPAASEPQTVVEQGEHTITVNGLTDKSSMAVTSTSVRISGQLSGSGLVRVYVNGEIVASSSVAGVYFGFDIPLVMGSNTIEVVAVIDGVELKKEFTVTRDEVETDKSSGSFESTPQKDDILPYILGASVAALVVVGLGWWTIAARRRKKKSEIYIDERLQ